MKTACAIVTIVLGVAAMPQRPENPPVIFLHYDYMVSTDPANQHSHEPHQSSIDLVVSAFKRQGLILHIDPKHTAIPEQPLNLCDVSGQPFGDAFTALRHQYFQPQGSQAWHYAVFGHSDQCADLNGLAELPGYNLVVTLHDFFTLFSCYDNFTDVCEMLEAGLFMHELGHNLDLHHGGADDINYKPNYLSVMSYAGTYRGFASAAVPGSEVIDDRR